MRILVEAMFIMTEGLLNILTAGLGKVKKDKMGAQLYVFHLAESFLAVAYNKDVISRLIKQDQILLLFLCNSSKICFHVIYSKVKLA